MIKVGTLVVLIAGGVCSGSASAEERTYEFAPFTSVSVSSGIAAVVVAGGQQSVRAEASNAATLNRLEIGVRDGRLSVGIEWNLMDYVFNLGRHEPITVYVTAPSINTAEASSGADVDVRDVSGPALSVTASSGASLAVTNVKADELRAEASSGASLDIAGTCQRLFADSSSGASVEAAALICSAADVEASSGAHAKVHATASVHAEASSGAGIDVLGNPPQVDRESSSGGSVTVAP